ncbi:MAG: hypothetical protein ACXAC7_12855, partial [Candidatus Hodarchaeales archaeon]
AGKVDDAKIYLKEISCNLTTIDNKIKWYYYTARCQSAQNQISQSIKTLKSALDILDKYEKNNVIPKRLKYDFNIHSTKEAIKNIIKANIATLEENWGIAEQELKKVILEKSIDFDIQLNCFEDIAEVELRQWFSNPTEINLKNLNKALDEWEAFISDKEIFISLCNLYLLKSKVSTALFQYNEAKKWLNKSKTVAERFGFPIYIQMAQDEISKINSQINQIMKFKIASNDISKDEGQLKNYLAQIAELFHKIE